MNIKRIAKTTQIVGFEDKRLLLLLCFHENPRHLLREKRKKKYSYETQEDRKWGSFALTENKRCIKQIKRIVRKRDILLLAFKRLMAG